MLKQTIIQTVPVSLGARCAPSWRTDILDFSVQLRFLSHIQRAKMADSAHFLPNSEKNAVIWPWKVQDGLKNNDRISVWYKPKWMVLRNAKEY